MNNTNLDKLSKNRTIPIFDCIYEIDDQVEFYTALGFEITYYQKAPYRFVTVKNEFTEISFFGDKKFEIGDRAGGCYIVVSDIDKIYETLRGNLKKYYGKIPISGLPRFSKLNKTTEDRRFNITDPSGNTLIVGEPFGDSTTLMDEEEERLKSVSKFEKNYKQAYRYAYSKEDFRAARNLLEYNFLKHSDDVSNDLKFKALILQMDIHINLENIDEARSLINTIESISLSEEENHNLEDEKKRFIELKEELDAL